MIGNQTNISGARGSFNANAQNQNIRDVENKVRLLLPYSRPIQSWFMTRDWAWEATTGAGGKKEWYEDKFFPSTTTLGSGGIVAGGTSQTINVDNDIFTTKDTVLCEATDQMYRITAVATGTITIASVDGSTVALVASQGATLQRLAPAFQEGDVKAVAMSVVAVPKYAYPQIAKKAVSLTGTQQGSSFYGGGDWQYQWAKKMMEADEELERAWLQNGASVNVTSGTSSQTLSAGFQSLTTNRFGYSGSLDKAEWSAGLKTQFQYTNSHELNAVAGGNALNDFETFMSAIWTITQESPDFELKAFGLMTTKPEKPLMVRYRHPQGMVNIMYDPQLIGKYSGDVIVFDGMNVKKIYMGDDEDGTRKMRAELNIKTPGSDVKEGQVLFHQGIAIALEETHSRFYKL